LRQALDSTWGWLLQTRDRPRGLFQRCEGVLLINEEEGAAMAAAHNVAGSILSIAYGLDRDKPDECSQVAVIGLDIVIAFAYDLLGLRVTSKNGLLVARHELVRNEIRRQEDDLFLVLKAAPTPAVVRELRARSQGVSVLGDYWYGE
jgi:hypothetical protein